jgi:hypothetical protein
MGLGRVFVATPVVVPFAVKQASFSNTLAGLFVG